MRELLILATVACCAMTSRHSAGQERPNVGSNAEMVSGERLALLRAHVDSRVSQANLYEVLGGIDTAVSGFGIGVAIDRWNVDRRGSVTLAAGFGVQIAALTAALAISRDATDAILEESLAYVPGVIGLEMAVSSRASDAERTMGIGLAIGSFGASTVVATNNALRLTGVSTMRAHEKVLDRSLQLSSAQFRSIEADYVRTRNPLPRVLLALPWAVGGVVTLSPAFNASTSSDDKTLAAGLGAFQLLDAILFLSTVDPVDAYCRKAEGACAELVASHRGLALMGRF